MSMHFLVTVHFVDDNGSRVKNKAKYISQLFGEAFAMDADANIEVLNIIDNYVTFKAFQQTSSDEPNGDFTEDNITSILEYIKNENENDQIFNLISVSKIYV